MNVEITLRVILTGRRKIPGKLKKCKLSIFLSYDDTQTIVFEVHFASLRKQKQKLSNIMASMRQECLCVSKTLEIVTRHFVYECVSPLWLWVTVEVGPKKLLYWENYFLWFSLQQSCLTDLLRSGFSSRWGKRLIRFQTILWTLHIHSKYHCFQTSSPSWYIVRISLLQRRINILSFGTFLSRSGVSFKPIEQRTVLARPGGILRQVKGTGMCRP